MESDAVLAPLPAPALRLHRPQPHGARLAAHPAEYPWGSAAEFAGRAPPWLATWWVDEVVAAARRLDARAAYATLLGRPPTPSDRALIRACTRSRSPGRDALDDLLAAAPSQVLSWLVRKAALADGRAPGLPMVDVQTILDVVARQREAQGPWMFQGARGRPLDLWPLAQASLLRDRAPRRPRGRVPPGRPPGG